MSYYIVEKDGYLCHYGVGHKDGGHSGRYKWGTGDRPYQRTVMDGKKKVKTSSEYGKKSPKSEQVKNLINDKILSILNNKKQKKKTKTDKKEIEEIEEIKDQKKKTEKVKEVNNIKESTKTNEDNDKFDQEKERILREGTAEEIFSIANHLTNNELQGAYSRLQTRINLEKMLSNEEKKSTFDKIDNAMQKIKKVGDWANTSINTYNNIAKILNTFAGTNLKPISSNFSDMVKTLETNKQEIPKKESKTKEKIKEESKTKEKIKKERSNTPSNNPEHQKLIDEQQRIRNILAKYDTSKKVKNNSKKVKEVNNTINPFRSLKLNKKGKK